MRSLSRSLLTLIFSLSLFACGRQIHPLSGQNLTVAQVPAGMPQTHAPVEKMPRTTDAKISTREQRAEARLMKKVVSPARHMVEKIAAKQERMANKFHEQLTAAKQVRKVQEIRLVDILFFVILAILIAVTLGILHQVGVSTDVAIFIAMGAALVIVVAYIYLHTYIFTA